jgi:serine/threonine protein kinase/tetratricopeptide (TPR) repeat protein
MNHTSDAQGPVELLAEEFLDRHKRGERPTIREYCDRHPELAGEIRDVFEALMMVEELRPGSSDASASLSNGAGPCVRRLDRLGDYRILREVGRGGMGVVYEAEQEALGRRVALKVLPEALSGDAKARGRFEREARAAARMHHTNIVPVFDVGHECGHAYYAMQLIHGQGLDLVIEDVKRLREPKAGAAHATTRPAEVNLAASLILGRFEQENLVAEATDNDSSADGLGETADYDASERPPSAVLPGQLDLSAARDDRRAYYLSVARIGQQTAAALAYAHARGVVHRDIKPSNLLLDAAGVVWVTDFGLAQTGESGMTRTGDILGTIRYMAPERFRGQCDARSDVYALGLTLYELLALEPAYGSSDRLELIERIRRDEPPAPWAVDRRIPRDLETVVVKAMAKEPRRRYQSADELGEDLARFIAGEPVRARRISAVERVGRWVGRKPMVAGLVAAVFLAMAIGTAVSASQALRARRAEAAALAAAGSERAARAAAQEREAESRAVLEFVEGRVFAAARPVGQQGGLGRDVKLREAIEAAVPHLAGAFTNQPLIEARLRGTLGVLYLDLGEGAAAGQFEASCALYERHRGRHDPDTARSLAGLAECYRLRGRYEEALELGEEALSIRRATLGPDHLETLRSMGNVALCYVRLQRFDEALRVGEPTLAMAREKLGPDHPETLRSMTILGNINAGLGRHAEAVRLQEDVLAIARELGPGRADTVGFMGNLGNAYASAGRHADALRLREEILPLVRAKYGPDHWGTLNSMINLGDSYRRVGRVADALELYRKLLALQTAKYGPDHEFTLSGRSTVASCQVQLGQGAEAVADILRVAEAYERMPRTDPVWLYSAACHRAIAAGALRSADRSPAGAEKATAQADRAMAWLERALAAGFKDGPNQVTTMALDYDLDALRDRDDFKRLLAKLGGSGEAAK